MWQKVNTYIHLIKYGNEEYYNYYELHILIKME